MPESTSALPFSGGKPRPWRTWPTGQPNRGLMAGVFVPIAAVRTAAISLHIGKEATIPASLSGTGRRILCRTGDAMAGETPGGASSTIAGAMRVFLLCSCWCTSNTHWEGLVFKSDY
jgi:hypothetical protein